VGRVPGQFLRRTELIKRSLRLEDEPKYRCLEPLHDIGAYGELDEGDAAEDVGGRVPAHGGGAGRAGRLRRTTADESGTYDDGFYLATRFASSDWLQSLDIPRSVMRADRLPMPFTPREPVHAATFHVGSRDEIETRHCYCSLTWTQHPHLEAADL